MTNKLELTDGCIVEVDWGGEKYYGPVEKRRDISEKSPWWFGGRVFTAWGELNEGWARITRVIAPTEREDHGDGTETTVATIACRLPKGWRAVGVRVPEEDEFFLDEDGDIERAAEGCVALALIVEQIPPQEPITLTPEQVAGLSKEAREEVLGVASS